MFLFLFLRTWLMVYPISIWLKQGVVGNLVTTWEYGTKLKFWPKIAPLYFVSSLCYVEFSCNDSISNFLIKFPMIYRLRQSNFDHNHDVI